LVNVTVTFPAFVVRLCLSNISDPPGLAAIAMWLAPLELGALAEVDVGAAAAAEVEFVAGAAAVAEELDELEPPQAATPSARAPALKTMTKFLGISVNLLGLAVVRGD
jgi:hypothetical protein